jgi:TolB-like protein
MGGFLGELKRRNVFRVGLVYLASSWLIAQVAAILVPTFALPGWFMRTVVIVLAAGFPIALVVAWLFELTPEGLKRTAEVDAEKSIRPLTGRKLDRLLIGVLVLIVAVLLGNQFLYVRPAGGPRESGAPAAAAGMPTIAVLPFADLSPNKDQEYFADGLSEELMDKLAQLKGLAVTGRTSSFAFKGKNEDLRTIGEKLGVENVLEGSVRKSGTELRITAQLINAKTGYHIWSETYDRKLDDVFAIQDDISKSVATALQVTLGVGGVLGVPGMTHNVEAFDEYLRAQAVVFATSSTEDIRAMISHLERATALDPDFALAWFRLQGVYSASAAGALPITIENAAAKADEALDRAKKSTPDSPILILVAALAAADQGQWLEADLLFRKAMSTAAGNSSDESDLGGRYGSFLETAGRMKEAIALLERARAVDPLNMNTAFNLAEAYAGTGNFAASLAEIDRAMTLEGNQENLRGTALLTALATGDKQEIDKRLQQVLERKSSIRFINVINGTLGALWDRRDEALAEMRRLADDPEAQSPIIQGAILVEWAAALGDPEYALARYRKLPLQVQRTYAFAVWRPIFRNMRTLPGFRDLVRDIGLVDYWRATGNWGNFCHPVGDSDFECS